MGRCSWSLQLEDGPHTVTLEHGYWSGQRRVWVDDRPAMVKGGFFLKVWAVGSRDRVTVGEHNCEVVVKPNFRTNNYDYSLLVDGQLVSPTQRD